MKAPIFSKITAVLKRKAAYSLTFLSLLIFPFAGLEAQPGWVAGTPSINTTGPTSITVNYGIDVPGTVYIIVFNINTSAVLTPLYVRGQAIAGGGGSIIATAVLPVAGGDVNATLQHLFGGLAVNKLHTIYFVAENSSGVLQASTVRLQASTLPV